MSDRPTESGERASGGDSSGGSAAGVPQGEQRLAHGPCRLTWPGAHPGTRMRCGGASRGTVDGVPACEAHIAQAEHEHTRGLYPWDSDEEWAEARAKPLSREVKRDATSFSSGNVDSREFQFSPRWDRVMPEREAEELYLIERERIWDHYAAAMGVPRWRVTLARLFVWVVTLGGRRSLPTPTDPEGGAR